MKKILFILCFLTHSAIANELTMETKFAITKYLDGAQNRYGIFGQSLAVLKDGKLVYLGASGTANIEFNVSATPDTIYSIYSVTKLFVSIRLIQLVEKGYLQLDDPLAKHLADIPEKWRSVTVLQALSHISGIPEYSQEDMNHMSGSEAVSHVADQPMEFKTGTRSRYNQTNFYFIQKIIEKYDSKNLQETIEANILAPFKLSHTSFGGEFNVIAGRATRYEGTKNGVRRVMRNDPPAYYYAANGMNSSVKDIAIWFEALLNEKLVNFNELEKIWRPIYLKDGSKAKHSHGWEFREVNEFKAVGHYGANFVNVRHFFKDDIKKDSVTIIHLTNGRSKKFDPFDFSYSIASVVMPSMQTPIRIVTERMLETLEKGDIVQAMEIYQKFKVDHPLQATKTENILNRLGYISLAEFNYESAIKIFELNTLEYPNSANTFDSLAEAYLKAGNKVEANKYYKKALSLDKENGRIKTILESLN